MKTSPIALLRCAALLGLATGTCSSAADIAQQTADAVYLNGVVWTADAARPTAEAFAVHGDRLVAIGSNVEVKKNVGAETMIVDLRGGFVVPGFIDVHAHYPGRPLSRLDLSGVDSLAEFQRQIVDFAAEHPTEKWIIGYGWGYGVLPEMKAHKRYVDTVVADRPVFLVERDGHMCLVNSKALELAGITRDTPNPENGQIVRDASGEPTGELLERAMRLVRKLLPAVTPEETYQAFKVHTDAAAAAGITSVQNAHGTTADHAVFVRGRDEGTLKFRLRLAWKLPRVGNAKEDSVYAQKLAELMKLREDFRGPLLEFGVLKEFVDGTVDARTAAMLEPLAGGANGNLIWKHDELNEAVVRADREGFQIMLHAVGDAAVRAVIDAYEQAHKTNGYRESRHRIEHAEIVDRADLARMKQLGVVVCTQPMFASPDSTTLRSFAVLLGPERAARADNFKQFDDAGIMQAFGTDWPYFPLPPLLGIYTAVTRMTPAGTPEGGWYPENRISVEAALRHYTCDAAYACFMEQTRGTLAPGKLADFVVLSRNLLQIVPAEILKTKVLLTVLGGRPTYRAEGW
jgi:predicted amidohydrolase YtcJ